MRLAAALTLAVIASALRNFGRIAAVRMVAGFDPGSGNDSGNRSASTAFFSALLPSAGAPPSRDMRRTTSGYPDSNFGNKKPAAKISGRAQRTKDDCHDAYTARRFLSSAACNTFCRNVFRNVFRNYFREFFRDRLRLCRESLLARTSINSRATSIQTKISPTSRMRPKRAVSTDALTTEFGSPKLISS